MQLGDERPEALYLLLRLRLLAPGAIQEHGEVVLGRGVEGRALRLLGRLGLLRLLHGGLRGLEGSGRLQEGALRVGHLLLGGLHGLGPLSQRRLRRLAGGLQGGQLRLRGLQLLGLGADSGVLGVAQLCQSLADHSNDLVLACVTVVLHHVEAAFGHGGEELAAARRQLLGAVDRQDHPLQHPLLEAQLRLLRRPLGLRRLRALRSHRCEVDGGCWRAGRCRGGLRET
mmetsp:Transcript_82845/g.213471  ORF Transcript_82845/g.213471 Transcript_82845/m.213471 type:complete len:228 (+) Transcript_82845:492-1175(+)